MILKGPECGALSRREPVRVICSPKGSPDGMRVFVALRAKEILDERQEAQSGSDYRQAA